MTLVSLKIVGKESQVAVAFMHKVRISTYNSPAQQVLKSFIQQAFKSMTAGEFHNRLVSTGNTVWNP